MMVVTEYKFIVLGTYKLQVLHLKSYYYTNTEIYGNLLYMNLFQR